MRAHSFHDRIMQSTTRYAEGGLQTRTHTAAKKSSCPLYDAQRRIMRKERSAKVQYCKLISCLMWRMNKTMLKSFTVPCSTTTSAFASKAFKGGKSSCEAVQNTRVCILSADFVLSAAMLLVLHLPLWCNTSCACSCNQ